MTTKKTIYLSKKGMKELKKTIAHLTRDRSDAYNKLRELDKTDHRDERLARAELLATIETFDSELADKKMTLSHAKLLPRKRDALKVAIGSVVELLDTNGRMIRYTLVESVEANPSDGRISIMSPLGQSLLGKQIQDIVEWSAGRLGTKQLRLVNIH